jgi:hypothetical protein
MRNNVTLTLPDTTLAALDGYARERSLPRSYAAQELLDRQLSGGRDPQTSRSDASTTGHFPHDRSSP